MDLLQIYIFLIYLYSDSNLLYYLVYWDKINIEMV